MHDPKSEPRRHGVPLEAARNFGTLILSLRLVYATARNNRLSPELSSTQRITFPPAAAYFSIPTGVGDGESACRRGSVRRSSPRGRPRAQPSIYAVHLEAPRRRTGEGGGPPVPPIRPCSQWGLPSRPVARTLVRSYRTVAPLPDPPWRRAEARRSDGHRRSSLCGTVLRVAPTGC